MDEQLQCIAQAIYNRTLAGDSLAAVLGKQYSRRHLLLPYDSRTGAADVEQLELSMRSYNCIKRTGLNTVGDLLDYLSSGKSIRTIRNLGAKSGIEIFERLADFCYLALTEEEKQAFLLDFVADNQASRRDGCAPSTVADQAGVW